MAVIDRRGKPLPEGHPLKDKALIIFGGKQPASSVTSSESTASASAQPDPMQPAADAIEDWLAQGAGLQSTDKQPKAR